MSSLTRGRLAGLAAIAAVAALAPASSAVAAPAGQLDWTGANIYDSTAPANTARTFFGYATTLAGGNVTPSAGATGPVVDGSSPRGSNTRYSFEFPYVPAGSATTLALNGTYEFDGTLTFNATTHGFAVVVTDPQVVFTTTNGTLAGTTAKLYATGIKGQAGPQVPYDRTQAVFDLDLSKAVVRFSADGAQTISCITPVAAVAGYAFPANYTPTMPQRDPAVFGHLAIRIVPDGAAAPATAAPGWASDCLPEKGANGTDGTNGTNGADGADGTNGVDGAQGPKGDTGAVGPQGATGAVGPVGPAGAAGPKGATGARGKTGPRGPRGRSVVRRASLARAAFAGTKARTVKVTRRGSKAVLATGTVKGRTLTYKATKKLTGKLVLRAGGRAVTVTVK